KENFSRDVSESLEVAGLRCTEHLLAIRIEIDQPIITNFQRARALSKFLRERFRHASPGSKRRFCKCDTQVQIRPRIVFAEQNVAFSIFQNKWIDHAETRIQK